MAPQNNKARRHELRMLKFKKRCAVRGVGWNLHNHKLRNTGKPCSCSMCSPHRELPYKPKFSDRRKMLIGTE